MSLPAAWIDRIHARLLVRYGAGWIRLWEGVPPEAVKADWAEVLSGLSQEAIGHALDHLPIDRAPTALQFRELCRHSPSRALAIGHDRPEPNPEKLAEVLGGLNRTPNERLAADTMASLREKRAAGNATVAQLDFLKRAEAGMDRFDADSTQAGSFTPPPDHVLPPAMQPKLKEGWV